MKLSRFPQSGNGMQGIGLPMSEITCRHPSPTRLSRQHEQESVPNLTSTAPLLGDTRHLSLWSSDPTLAVDTEKNNTWAEKHGQSRLGCGPGHPGGSNGSYVHPYSRTNPSNWKRFLSQEPSPDPDLPFDKRNVPPPLPGHIRSWPPDITQEWQNNVEHHCDCDPCCCLSRAKWTCFDSCLGWSSQF